jgi:hypothetical protein
VPAYLGLATSIRLGAGANSSRARHTVGAEATDPNTWLGKTTVCRRKRSYTGAAGYHNVQMSINASRQL